MGFFQHLLNQHTLTSWVLIPSAVLLGALHGLEPGHSKTLMAAFVIAIRGTIAQAALLGICAALSHSLIIWLLAALALNFGPQWDTQSTEPYFQFASAAIILGLALWMFCRTRREQLAAPAHGCHHHHHGEENQKSGFSDHGHEDSHARAHAKDIARRFQNRSVTTGQIVLFGLSGGLLPCPAALTVLLICLQLKKFTLGFLLVLCFSIGLALVMVGIGVATAWGVRHASQKIRNFSTLAQKAPYLSSAILSCLAIYLAFQGWHHLH
ncbi:MAG: nickel/cobalt efflux protein RcnA [Verrucomicrobia bacterium]|nr:MAG: nickel/cobalt efflux protein RcnA [Verrucomicrobiota bacterium]